MERQKGFVITEGKGFQMTFENGYTVSVQWGSMNFCDNRAVRIETNQQAIGEKGSNTAEVAFWKDNGELLSLPEWNDCVRGWLSPNEVVKFLNLIAHKKG